MAIVFNVTGKDERKEILEFPANDQRRASARGVVSLFFEGKLKRLNGNEFECPDKFTHGQIGVVKRQLCSKERFINQPTGAFLSGVLVCKDIVATTSHGLPSGQDIKKIQFVFDYLMSNDSSPALIRGENVYVGKSIIDRNDDTDWALVRLDRSVPEADRVRLLNPQLALKGRLVYTIGHPHGLPAKFGGTAIIWDVNENGQSFKAGLDASKGNSGSPVFDAETHTVVGLIATDETPDFRLCNEDDGCDRMDDCCITNAVPGTPSSGDTCVKVSNFASLAQQSCSRKGESLHSPFFAFGL